MAANHVHQKYTTTSKETYAHPKSVPAYRNYLPNRPQTFGTSYEHGQGTVKCFNDYRRSQVPENVMRENMDCIGLHQRPTWFSDKPDRVLGARAADREALLNRPDYKLLNRIPDREKELAEFEQAKEDHREHSKDLTNTKPSVGFFHYPTEANEQFSDRNVSGEKLGDFPTPHKVSLEHTWETRRGPKHYELHHGLSDFNYHKKIPEI